jgi:hypothetical protein
MLCILISPQNCIRAYDYALQTVKDIVSRAISPGDAAGAKLDIVSLSWEYKLDRQRNELCSPCSMPMEANGTPKARAI